MMDNNFQKKVFISFDFVTSLKKRYILHSVLIDIYVRIIYN